MKKLLILLSLIVIMQPFSFAQNEQEKINEIKKNLDFIGATGTSSASAQEASDNARELLALEALHMVRLAAEHGHAGIQPVDVEIHMHRLEAGLLPVALGHAVGQHGMLVAAHREHPHLAACRQQTLGDTVHGQRAAVHRRIGRLVAKLQYFHGIRVCVIRRGGL